MHTDQIIGIISNVKIKDGCDDEYHRLLLDLIALHSTRETDCIDITVHRSVDDPTRIMLYERWRIPRDRFLAEQMTKPFIQEFTDLTRDMLAGEDDVTYWSATDLVASGARIGLAGTLRQSG